MIGKHATAIYTDGGVTIVQYHDTKVVDFNDSRIILNHGGYKTATTKRRMNETSETFSLGYRVFQKGFTWYVEYNGQVVEMAGSSFLIDRGEN